MDETESKEGELGVHVVIEGRGFSLDTKVSETIARRLMVVALTDSDAPTSGLAMQSSQRPTTGAMLSPREFLDQSNARSFPEKIVSVGQYAKAQGGVPVFGRKILLELLERAGEKVPRNIPRDIQKTVKEGWIEEKPGARNLYYVTAKGEAAVRDGFGKSTRREETRRVGRHSSSREQSSRTDNPAET